MTVAVVVTVVSLKFSKPKYHLLQEGLLTYSPQMWDGCFSSAPMASTAPNRRGYSTRYSNYWVCLPHWTMNSSRARMMSYLCLYSCAWQRAWTTVDNKDLVVEWTFHSFPSIFLSHMIQFSQPSSHTGGFRFSSGSIEGQRRWGKPFLQGRLTCTPQGPDWNPGVLALGSMVFTPGHTASRKPLWFKKVRFETEGKVLLVRDPERSTPWSSLQMKAEYGWWFKGNSIPRNPGAL